MTDRYLVNQYQETKAKFYKFTSRLQNSQKRGDFQRYSKGKQNYLLNRIQKLWQKLRVLEARLKMTTAGVSLALILMVSSLGAQERFVLAPEKNPLPPPTVFGFEPFLVDVDNDGDLDLFASPDYESIVLFENTGTPAAPAFVRVSDASNPLNHITDGAMVNIWEISDAGDLDGDGDMELIVDGGFVLWNTGSNDDIQYTIESDVIFSHGTSERLADMDGDGDLDLISVSYNDSVLNIYENVGSASAYNFSVEPVSHAVSNWNDEIYHVDYVYPADLDNDGDLDLVIGVNIYDYYSESMDYETLRVIENSGSASAPEFVLKEEVNNPYRDIRIDNVNLGDLDGDGDFDLLVFEYYSGGGMQYFELDNNTVTENRELIPEMYDGIILPFSYMLSPQFVDYDGDGDLDIIAFAYYGSKDFLKYYEYRDTGAQLKYTPIDNKSFGFIDPEKDIQLPFFVDLDGDSDLDLIRASYDYDYEKIDYIYMENRGTDAAPLYNEQPVPALTGRDELIIPAFADIDGDGDVDIFAWEYTYLGEYSYEAGIHYYESTGTDPVEFTERVGDDNPLALVTEENFPEVEEYLRPVFADIDQDGDYDVVFNGAYGLYYLENQGSPTHPVFVDRSETGPFSSLQLGYFTFPTLADMDGDGDLDLLAHEFYGLITSYYENTGPTGSPDFKKMEMHSMDIYPNPVADVLHVNLGNSETGTLNYEIISLESRQIQNGSPGDMGNTTQFSIDTGYLLPGQYVLKVRSGERLYISKFLKL